MFSETRIAAAAQRYIAAMTVPTAPTHEILRRTGHREERDRMRFYIAGILAAAVALVVAAPRMAPGFMQTVEQQVETILRWTPPPPAPARVESAMRSQSVTLAQARARVDFTIVPPDGLPHDARLESIVATPTGVYSNITHRWSVGDPAVSFVYRRRDAGSFTLVAERFDSRQGPPSKYIFADLGERNGHALLVRHERFVWRNGDQIMSAVADDRLSPREIARIRAAMSGIPLPGVWPPRRGSIEKQYRL